MANIFTCSSLVCSIFNGGVISKISNFVFFRLGGIRVGQSVESLLGSGVGNIKWFALCETTLVDEELLDDPCEALALEGEV